MAANKETLKKVLGELPLTAEVYWLLRQNDRPSPSNFSLRHIREILPDAVKAAAASRVNYPAGKKVFMFASTHYWLEHEVMTGLALAGLGHHVTLAYYPYGRWNVESSTFDIRRQNMYASTVLRGASSMIDFENLLRNNSAFVQLPQQLLSAVDQVTDYDYMYAFQTEEVNREDGFYTFRHDRNMHAAKSLSHLPAQTAAPGGNHPQWQCDPRVWSCVPGIEVSKNPHHHV